MNTLETETSPYLLQHKDNPVHWVPWSDDAFERARKEDKPVLLSVGYAACHWCHVMAHESFEDDETAKLMNELFVNVKVDREERPDVDMIYQNALALMGQQGGWPLTMFLTPEGKPFWGGTYFPPQPRFGRMSFPDVLQVVAKSYREERDKVEHNTKRMLQALRDVTGGNAGPMISRDMLDRIATHLTTNIDPVNGGIGDAPKFPHCGVFELLWRAWVRTQNTDFRAAVLLTLKRMCKGGIYDHVGGGFARYTVDAEWLVPHFEKMLYDNAQIVKLLTCAWQDTRAPIFETCVRETIAWLLDEMKVEDADGFAFAGTLDADSEGEEGKFYVWDADEIDAALGDGADLFKQVYDITAAGNWEGVNIPNRLSGTDQFDADTLDTLAKQRKELKKIRDKRVRPGRDDKVLADWNGLMIEALACAGFAFSEQDWIDAAETAFAFITRNLAGKKKNRLAHSWCDGKSAHDPTLDDYANMSAAVLKLYEVTGNSEYLAQAENWVETVETEYRDNVEDGYFFTSDTGDKLILRPKTAQDAATPAGNATMIAVLTRLSALTGNTAYADTAEKTLRAFSGEVNRNFFPLATFLNAAELYLSPLQIVVAGEKDGAETSALLDVVREFSLPNLILNRVTDPAQLPEGHPARPDGGKGNAEKATAYLCSGQTCRLPVHKPDDLRALISEELENLQNTAANDG